MIQRDGTDIDGVDGSIYPYVAMAGIAFGDGDGDVRGRMDGD